LHTKSYDDPTNDPSRETIDNMTDGPDFLKGTDGLLPAIAQDAQTLQVLMMAWMNQKAGTASAFSKCASIAMPIAFW
jgi:phosphoribosyl-AMP cyclohydrolase